MERKASRIAIRTCSAWTTPLAYGAYHSGGALLQLGARFLGIYGDLIQVIADDACQPTNILDCFQWRVEHKLFIFLRNLTFWSTPIFFFRCTTLHIFEIVDFQLESRILPLESDQRARRNTPKKTRFFAQKKNRIKPLKKGRRKRGEKKIKVRP